MKRILSALLCLTLIFRITAVPTFAAEISYDIIPYSQNFAGDVITYTDELGHIIEVRPNDVGIYGAAPVLPYAWTIIEGGLSTAAGAAGATGGAAAGATASASIAGAALPILGYILAAGVIIWSVYGIADCVMDMYHLLSDDAQAELAEITENGEGYNLSDYPHLAAELPVVFGQTFYNDDGSFKASGVTFDPSCLLEYNYDTQYVYGDNLTSSSYIYDLSSSPVNISGTSLYVSLVDSPFSDDRIKHVFKYRNFSTGASLFTMPSYSSEWLEHDCCSYKLTAPAVTTHSDLSNRVFHTLGVWVLRVCSIEQGGGNCDVCLVPYQSRFFGDSDSTINTTYIQFNDTGIEDLDGVQFNSQWHTEDYWYLQRVTPLDGVSGYKLPFSALQYLSTDLSYSITQTDAAALPDNATTIYLPSADALSDANHLTQKGALSNDWTATQSEAITDNPSVPDVDSEGFFANLIEAIKTAIMSLFIPSEGFFEQFIADINATFQDRMGILTFPVSLLYDFLGHFLDIGDEEPVFVWGAWEYQGIEFIPSGSFNFNDLLENETFAHIHDIYLLIVDAGIVFGLVALLRRKYNSIISN